MKNLNISKLPINDALLIETKINEDERGSFSRFFCSDELNSILNESKILNINFSHSKKKGTIRGLHFQKNPHQEKKFIRCISGRIFDVIVDLRKDSSSYLSWYGVELNAIKKNMLYVPEGFAHGFQTLEDNSEIIYFVSNYYSPVSEGGYRFNDPVFKIKWPLDVTEISYKDLNYPDFVEL